MLKDFGTAAALIALLAMGLFVLHLVADQWTDRGGGAWAHGVDQAVLLLLVMLFVPLLRRLEPRPRADGGG